MLKRDKWIVAIILMFLTLISVLGIRFVLQMQGKLNQGNTLNHMMDFRSLGMQGDDDTTLDIDSNNLRFEWNVSKKEEIVVQSQAIPIEQNDKSSLQLDVNIGGKNNAYQSQRTGYMVYLQIVLLDQNATVEAKKIEIPLESERNRSRLYSIVIPIEKSGVNAYKIQWIIQPLNNTIDAGYIICNNLEVI